MFRNGYSIAARGYWSRIAGFCIWPYTFSDPLGFETARASELCFITSHILRNIWSVVVNFDPGLRSSAFGYLLLRIFSILKLRIFGTMIVPSLEVYLERDSGPESDCPGYLLRWRLDEVLARGGMWFLRSTTFSLGVMGRWEGAGLGGNYGKEN